MSQQTTEIFAPAVRHVILERLGRWLPSGDSIAVVGHDPLVVSALRSLGYSVSFPADAKCTLVLGAGQWTESVEDFVEDALSTMPRGPVCFALRGDMAPEPRVALERAMLRREWRKHPLYQSLAPYGELDRVSGLLMAAFERVPEVAAAMYPLTALEAERDLHTDMTREAGRRSDAHLARYVQASGFVKPGDKVIDVACGLGYGSYLVARSTQASAVSGVDLSEFAIAYARSNFELCLDSRLEFRVGDAQDLSHFDNESADFAISVETLEHVPDPVMLLRDVHRVLAPGGLLYASVPNDWSDESGRDPNPFHLHVYDWQALSHQLEEAGFSIRRAWLQDAGGGQKRHMVGRSMLEFDTAIGPQTDGEWLLVLAEKATPRILVNDADRVVFDVEALLGQGNRQDAVAMLAHASNNLPTASQRAVMAARLALLHSADGDASRSEEAWHAVVNLCRTAMEDVSEVGSVAPLIALGYDALSRVEAPASYLLCRHPEAALALRLDMFDDYQLGPDRAFMDGVGRDAEPLRLASTEVRELYDSKQWLDAKYHEQVSRISELESYASQLEEGRQWLEGQYFALKKQLESLSGQ